MFPSRKSLDSGEHLHPFFCFNGAGMFPSRKFYQQTGCSISPTTLQWGRDVSIPEISPITTGVPGLYLLQWGRDVSIPEIAQAQAATDATALLQWGRDVSIPEITLPQWSCLPAARFNGAGMFPSRKWPLTILFCFQGPARPFTSASRSPSLIPNSARSRAPLTPAVPRSYPSASAPRQSSPNQPLAAAYRVVNTGYSAISPSSTRASNLAWISSIRR